MAITTYIGERARLDELESDDFVGISQGDIDNNLNTIDLGNRLLGLMTDPRGLWLMKEAPGADLVTDGGFTDTTKAAAKGVAGITKATPGVVSFDAGHGYSDGDVIYFSGLTEMTELNTEYWILRSNAGDTFELQTTVGNSLDTSGYGTAETTGGDCAQATDLTSWTEGVGWHPGVDGAGALNGVVHSDASQTVHTYVQQSTSIVIGSRYRVTYTISNYSAGEFKVLVGGSGIGATRTANGTYTETITCKGTTGFLMQGNSAFLGDIDNVSMSVPVFDTHTGVAADQHDGEFKGSGWASGALEKQGRCLKYDPDGATDFINVGDDTDFEFVGLPFTVGALVEVSASTGIQTIIAKWDSGTALREWKLFITALEEGQFSLYDESVDTEPYVKSAVLSEGLHLIIGTDDGTSGNDADDGMNMYIDGVLDNTAKSGTVGYTDMEASATPVTICGSLNSGAIAEALKGDIGSTFIDGVEWSAHDVWNLWNEILAKYSEDGVGL